MKCVLRFSCSPRFLFSFVLLLLLLLTLVPQSTDCSTSLQDYHEGDENAVTSPVFDDKKKNEQEEEQQDDIDSIDNRPNILLLLTDDQDVMVGGLDKMQHLQRLLQQQGTTYTNAYVHTPICCPSRTSIYTGRYLHNGGAIDNSVQNNCNGYDWQQDAELQTFAVHAKIAGYVTSFAGKYLNGYGIKGSPHCHDDDHDDDNDDNDDDNSGCTRVPPGWDKWLGLIGNSQYYNYGVVVHTENDGMKNATVENHGNDYSQDYFPDLVANFTLKQMEQFIIMNKQANNRRRPFLAVTAWPTAHGPFTPAPWAENMFKNGTIHAHVTPNYNASAESLQSKHWMMRWLAPIDAMTAKWIDQVYENRTKALQSVDVHIQQFIHLLKQHDDEYNNTIIIYTSDNGWQLGQHRLSYDKRQLYEHDIRVPFIISGPGVPQNVTNTHDIILNIDIAPTIYHFVTGTNPVWLDFMDGQSLLPTLSLQQPQTTTATATNKDATMMNKDTTATTNNHDSSNDDDDQLEEEEEEEVVVVAVQHRRRHDFLISYHGEGIKQCGNFWQCPVPDKEHYHMGDWTNNTYHCVRTIRRIGKQQQQPSSLRPRPLLLVDDEEEEEEEKVQDSDDDDDNSIYCRFSDDENFVEYYDLIADPWQLHNAYDSLTLEQRQWYDGRLRALQSCKGQSCRSHSSNSKKPIISSTVPVNE